MERSSQGRESMNSLIQKLASPENDIIFLMGDTLSGKTRLLNEYKDSVKSKPIVCVAGTSKSALDINGQDLFSFFEFPLTTLDKDFYTLLDKSKLLDVDEIIIDGFNFDRLDLFLAIVRSLKYSLGGGLSNIRLIFSGRPVSKSLESETMRFYNSMSYQESLRWKRPFIVALSPFTTLSDKTQLFRCISNSVGTFEELLENRTIGDPKHSNVGVLVSDSNDTISSRNLSKMDSLISKLQFFAGKVNGDFCIHKPTDENLYLKEGSEVMFVDSQIDLKGDFLYKRGGLGRFLGKVPLLSKDTFRYGLGCIRILKEDGKIVCVNQKTWHSVKYIGGKKKEVGSFTQYPIILADAMRADYARSVRFKIMHLDFKDLFKLSDFISDWVAPDYYTLSERTYNALVKELENNERLAV